MVEAILNLLFPPKCIFCGTVLEAGSRFHICSLCYSKIPFIKGTLPDASWSGSFYDEVICVCEYTGIVKNALVKYKFFEKPSYCRAFAMLMSEKVKQMTNSTKFDIISCVPLHKEKEKLRGYNQSLLIARILSRETGIPLKKNILIRTENTCSQSLLSKRERLKNIRDAFQVNNADSINNKSILLVDDVFTTGATVGECSRVLKEAGAKKVVVAVVASGRKY